ncbi:hypothetical protein KIL84_023000 [Mauremys mutica]|uniref:Uncharacterized protein n=1 Tax=Mauremys mutica TaxID=74926 RepID=A0A9D3WPF7_9SAUR|nr:hypothetical protein KIL84_023000 [Mauremys mutica]
MLIFLHILFIFNLKTKQKTKKKRSAPDAFSHLGVMERGSSTFAKPVARKCSRAQATLYLFLKPPSEGQAIGKVPVRNGERPRASAPLAPHHWSHWGSPQVKLLSSQAWDVFRAQHSSVAEGSGQDLEKRV